MPLYPAETLATYLPTLTTRWLNAPLHDRPFDEIAFDSRRIIQATTSVFFALRGARQDGHSYISELYAQGVRNFVVSEWQDVTRYEGANFLLTDDVVRALQVLAIRQRKHFSDLRTIGITGSNGKTIVKEWLFQLLQADFNIVRSPRSYNSQVGVPYSVWQIRAEHNLGIFEVGVSRKGEMEKLRTIVAPTIGIFTMLGEAHAEGFDSLAQKVAEKVQLFKLSTCAQIIYCCDDPIVDSAIRALKRQTFRWSKTEHPEADLQCIDLQRQAQQTRLQLRYRRTKDAPLLDFVVPFADTASVDNALTCIATLLYLGYPSEVIARRVARLESVAMRLELKEGINRSILINDTYNSDLLSLDIALDFMQQQQSGKKRRTLVLSDILQSGRTAAELYERVATLVAASQLTRLVVIGESVQMLKPYLNQSIEFQHFETTELFLQQLPHFELHDEIVLLKGARIFGFERIAARWTAKAHKTVLEVNLNALAHNLQVYRSLIAPTTKLMVMVKAAAYGIGSEEVAQLLEAHRTDYLAVAYADEGIELRKAGIRLPIMVLNPEANSFEAILRYDLEPELYTMSLLEDFLRFTEHSQNIVKVHLKLDTGMHRLGFEANDITHACQLLVARNNIRVASIFSHLAASEADTHRDFTELQIERLNQMYEVAANILGYRPLRHILNSSGIHRFPDAQMDMVRLGIGLYGVASDDALQRRLRVVQTLKATISQIKNIAVGETIGYGRRGEVHTPKRTATISIGYADGFLRGASNGRFSVALHGQLAPVIGNVCMDMTMIDVTHIPDAQAGDEVEIFGNVVAVQTLATALNTIAYEVFTGISKRVKRVYVWE